MNSMVSIVVPVYNAAAVIAETIASVERQTYTDWELCLADGSDDEHSYVENTHSIYKTKAEYISSKL